MLCYETLDDSGSDEISLDLHPPRKKKYCSNCVRAKLTKKSKPKFRPLRLEHLAIVSTLKTFVPFTRELMLSSSYQAFRSIVKLCDARFYLVKLTSTGAQISRIMASIDRLCRLGVDVFPDFSKTIPICCCTILDFCASKNSKNCPNAKPYNYHRFRFCSMHNSHMVNNAACCCDGMCTSYCKKKYYVSRGIAW